MLDWRTRHFAQPADPLLLDLDFEPQPVVQAQESIALAYRLNPNGLRDFLALQPVTPLYAHQVSGAAFMLERTGGGYCDDLRTGKTRATLYAAVTAQQRAVGASPRGPSARWGRPILVVCPGDLLDTWQSELEALYGPRALAVLRLDTEGVARSHESRASLLTQLREETDLVLVSVSYLVESTHVGAVLLRDEMAFSTLLCDEAHLSVSPDTQSYEVLCRLRAASKWYITGTPIQNSLRSLTAALTFMGVPPARLAGLSNKELVALARTLTLRRTWALTTMIPRLPVPTVTPLEQRVFRAAVAQLLAAVDARPPRMKKLTLIHVLRQLVLSPYLPVCRDLYDRGILTLPPGAVMAPAALVNGETDPALLEGGGGGDYANLVMALALREQTFEAIGADPRAAWQQLVPARWNAEQPLVCQHLRRRVDALKAVLVPCVSPKERWFCQVLLAQRVEPAREKVVFFSGFHEPLQRMRRLLQMRRDLGVPGATGGALVDGDLTVAQRRAERDRLASDATCGVLLSTLKVSSVGLDLTDANHAVVNDPWYNPTPEQQAVGRIQGPRQTRAVHTYRLVCPGTIDECIADRADAKTLLAQQALPQTLLAQQAGGPVEVSAVGAEEAYETPEEEHQTMLSIVRQLRALVQD